MGKQQIVTIANVLRLSTQKNIDLSHSDSKAIPTVKKPENHLENQPENSMRKFNSSISFCSDYPCFFVMPDSIGHPSSKWIKPGLQTILKHGFPRSQE